MGISDAIFVSELIRITIFKNIYAKKLYKYPTFTLNINTEII